MSVFTIPNDRGEIRVNNTGEVGGELVETFNIDLSTSRGKIKVSDKLVPVLVESTDFPTNGNPVDMITWDDENYLITDDGTYKCGVDDDPTDPDNWSTVVAVDDVDLESTAVIFDGEMRISRDVNISQWNGGGTFDPDWWTDDVSGPALTDNKPHTLAVVQSQKETLYVTDANEVHYLEKGGTVQTVTLDSAVTANCLAGALSGAMWVGTFNETSGNTFVYEIYTGEAVDSTPVYRQAYEINARAVLAIWVKDNTPFIVTERGEIQQFNGAGFVTVGEFPFKFSPRTLSGVRSGLIQDSNRSRPIHPRGVRVHNDSAFININTESAEDAFAVDARSHSGVWEFNHKTGQLNHRFAHANASNEYGESAGSFGYPLLIIDNEFTFLMVGGYNQNTGKETIYMTDPDAVNQGYFMTPEITSQSVTDTYEAVYHKAKTMTSGEEIVTQYRVTKRDSVNGTANWTGTTTFVVTDDWSSVQEGELVRVSHGYGAGDYANITNIQASTNTYTVTVDKAIGLNGETSYVVSDNFLKDAQTYTSEHGEFHRQGGFGTNPWIQFLVFLKGKVEYRQFICRGNSKNEL